MSTRGGNSKKTGQKYQNVKKYRNNMHDTSDRTKKINSLTIGGVCVRCKDIIDWKIAYKKYKPLKTPKKCVGCGQKTVKQAYYTMCSSCARQGGLCAKCGQKRDIVESFPLSESEKMVEEAEFKHMLKQMNEREKRAFLREQLKPQRVSGSISSEERLPPTSCRDTPISSNEDTPLSLDGDMPPESNEDTPLSLDGDTPPESDEDTPLSLNEDTPLESDEEISPNLEVAPLIPSLCESHQSQFQLLKLENNHSNTSHVVDWRESSP